MKTISISIYLMLSLLLISAGCSDDGDGALINKGYDLILGFAVPDEDRLDPIEVFVGRIRPVHPPENRYIVQGAEDEFLREQIFKYVDVYRGNVVWYEDAEVTISSEGQAVVLENTGFGIYRDVKNELHIEPLKQYFLEVKRPNGLVYTDEVTVPGDIFITNFSPGDTLVSYPKRQFSDLDNCLELFPLEWNKGNKPKHAGIYQAKESNDGLGFSTEGYFKHTSFDIKRATAPVQLLVGDPDRIIHFQWEKIVLDSTATVAYNPFGSFSGSEPEADHFDFWRNPANIALRNGITVNKDRRVIGNFGAYNAFRMEFTVLAKSDSCR